MHLIGCCHCLANNFPLSSLDFKIGVESDGANRATHGLNFGRFSENMPKFITVYGQFKKLVQHLPGFVTVVWKIQRSQSANKTATYHYHTDDMLAIQEGQLFCFCF